MNDCAQDEEDKEPRTVGTRVQCLKSVVAGCVRF